MTYSYDPSRIKARGKDQMRFELGDTLTDGGEKTCALSDEEYSAVLEGLGEGKRAWLKAKLYALDAILLKMSYMVDTKIDVLSYGMGDRAERWRKLRDDVKEEISSGSGFPAMDGQAASKPPYFYAGMQGNPGAK